jgi:hypothetical protein
LEHRIKAEGQNIPPAIEESSESEAPMLENAGEHFLPGAVVSAEITHVYIARCRFAEWYVQGKKTMDPHCGVGDGTYALAGFSDTLGIDLSRKRR